MTSQTGPVSPRSRDLPALGIAGLVLALVSTLCWCLPIGLSVLLFVLFLQTGSDSFFSLSFLPPMLIWGGVVLALIGAGLGILGLVRTPAKKGLSIAAIVVGGLMALLSAATVLLVGGFFSGLAR